MTAITFADKSKCLKLIHVNSLALFQDIHYVSWILMLSLYSYFSLIEHRIL